MQVLLIFGFVLFTSLQISLLVLIVGGIVAPITEAFSSSWDDNWTVPIISGAVMTVVSMFL